MTAFKKQILLGVILVILANILAFAFHRGLFSNIAWIVYGLLWIVHPVCPEQMDAKKGPLAVRLAGAACILIGLVTRFVVS